MGAGKKGGRPPKKKPPPRTKTGRWGKEKAPDGDHGQDEKKNAEGSEDGGGAAEAEGASPSQRVLGEECDSLTSLTPLTPELPSTSDGLSSTKEKAPTKTTLGHRDEKENDEQGPDGGGGVAEAEGAPPSQRVLGEECDSLTSLTLLTPELPSTSDGLSSTKKTPTKTTLGHRD